jgi:soluble P-type ATPase
VISFSIPDFGDLTLKHIVTDYNGTLALDGRLIPGVAEVITTLAPQIEIHIVTADTFGLAKRCASDRRSTRC